MEIGTVFNNFKDEEPTNGCWITQTPWQIEDFSHSVEAQNRSSRSKRAQASDMPRFSEEKERIFWMTKLTPLSPERCCRFIVY